MSAKVENRILTFLCSNSYAEMELFFQTTQHFPFLKKHTNAAACYTQQDGQVSVE